MGFPQLETLIGFISWDGDVRPDTILGTDTAPPYSLGSPPLTATWVPGHRGVAGRRLGQRQPLSGQGINAFFGGRAAEQAAHHQKEDTAI